MFGVCVYEEYVNLWCEWGCEGVCVTMDVRGGGCGDVSVCIV